MAAHHGEGSQGGFFVRGGDTVELAGCANVGNGKHGGFL